ncbi:MAG: DUF4388 domain-containing protein [Acidobacteriota bacterium]
MILHTESTYQNTSVADDYRNATRFPSNHLEMNGDLADFSLTDVLQILSISKKSGTLFIDSDDTIYCILLEEGKITHASIRPGETFADRLLRENKISARILNELKSVGVQDDGIWTLQTLLIESGILGRKELFTMARRHLTDVISFLLSLERGKFGFDLSVKTLLDPFNEIALPHGVDVGELLLASAKERDEADWYNESSVESIDDEGERFTLPAKEVTSNWVETFDFGVTAHETVAEYDAGVEGEAVTSETAKLTLDESAATEADEDVLDEPKPSLVMSLLAEMRNCSFAAEVSLLIMRYLSEVAPRSILFVVRETEIQGFGQFGIESLIADKTPDEAVRSIRIAIGSDSLFDHVLQTGEPFIGTIPHHPQHEYLFDIIGGNDYVLNAFVLPIYRNNRPAFLVYGDNYPSLTELTGVDELMALTTQASIVLEKMELENKLTTARLASVA